MPKTFELNQTDKQQKCTGCFSESIHLITDKIEICNPSNKYIDILIMITSFPQNKLSRNAMRDTWLRHTKNNTGNIRYDIILGSFKDAYNSLTFKTLMGFQWANKRCPNAQFVMKTDDDVYVHNPGLKKSHFGGRCQHIASPVRDKRSKWYASFDSYPEKTYPGYCSGTGYVTSLNVITKIVKISKSVPFFNLEDVFVALCIKKLVLRLNPITGFMLAYDFVNCKNNDNKLVTIHQVSVSILRRIWEIPCNANKV
ncbi:beta-1,3-galactosyltransferase 1-like [Mytilus trossulus]|uniref:beta-1,3-galactosyltransferase 1-like n=1 Tax=Mytilus trossulus TaxID=6551 RepID=UPI0030042AB8